MRKAKRRGQVAGHVVLWASIAVLLLPLAGCGRGEPEPAPQSPLRVGISTDVEHWSFREFPGGDARFVWSQVYETLVRLTRDLKIVPGLATSWASSADGKTWEFRLREGVKFHDDTPLTAEAVVFSYNRDSYSRRTVLRAVERIEADGPYTVRFSLKRPMPLPHYLTHVAWPIMSPSGMDEQGRIVRPIGTGPFHFKSQKEDQEIVLTRNEHYWGGAPRLEQVVFKVVPAAAARVIALEGGELDMSVKVAEADVKRLESHEGITVHRALSTFTDFIQFNCRKEPLSDVRLRRAVAHAIDTGELVGTILEGVGKPARGRPFCPNMLHADPDLELYEPDPAKARELLAQAGWKDADGDGIAEKGGHVLRVILLVTQNENVGAGGRFAMMAEAIQAALKAVGMDVRIQQFEGGAFLRAERKGEFDMLLRTGFYVWGAYPRHFFLHHSDNIYSHLHNPELDDLITKADAAVDITAQRDLYHQLQRKTLQLMPAFYLVHQEKVVATGPRVRGYEISSEAPWLNLRGVHLR